MSQFGKPTIRRTERERESWSTKTSEDLKRALGPLESLQATSTSSLRRQINYDERVITIVKERTNERPKMDFIASKASSVLTVLGTKFH